MSDKQIVPVIEQETCSHPELIHETQLTSFEYVYYCSACRKKVIIPTSTMLEIKSEGLLGIIGLAFGEKWKRQLEGRV